MHSSLAFSQNGSGIAFQILNVFFTAFKTCSSGPGITSLIALANNSYSMKVPTFQKKRSNGELTPRFLVSGG
jgi:hypothetical protein